MKITWEGVFPAVTTNLSKNDTLDLDAFGKNIDVQLAAGVDGIIIGGTLGGLGIESNALELAAPLLVLSVLWMRRHEEPLRTQLLASLPPELVDRLPA